MMTTISTRGFHRATPRTQNRAAMPRSGRTGVLVQNRRFRRSWEHSARQAGKADPPGKKPADHRHAINRRLNPRRWTSRSADTAWSWRRRAMTSIARAAKWPTRSGRRCRRTSGEDLVDTIAEIEQGLTMKAAGTLHAHLITMSPWAVFVGTRSSRWRLPNRDDVRLSYGFPNRYRPDGRSARSGRWSPSMTRSGAEPDHQRERAGRGGSVTGPAFTLPDKAAEPEAIRGRGSLLEQVERLRNGAVHGDRHERWGRHEGWMPISAVLGSGCRATEDLTRAGEGLVSDGGCHSEGDSRSSSRQPSVTIPLQLPSRDFRDTTSGTITLA